LIRVDFLTKKFRYPCIERETFLTDSLEPENIGSSLPSLWATTGDRKEIDEAMSGTDRNGEDPVAKTVLRALDEARRELGEFDSRRKPLLDRVARLERALHELNLGPLKSDKITDSEIVLWIRDNSSEDDRRTTPEVALAFAGDGRGFARRLKRMSEQRPALLDGSPQDGYYVEGYDHGREVSDERQTAVAG
jgi:hypothetical protein